MTLEPIIIDKISIVDDMKRNPMKPQLRDSLKPLLENKIKTNILQTRLNLNCT
jgi:hypothetical protein